MAEGQGRSSGQGVKLLYIRDYLRKYTDEEHPQNAKAIKAYLASKGIKASEKTIYNDILRLQVDFDEPIAYNPKRWGYYITKPQFTAAELAVLIDCIRYAPYMTQEDAKCLTDKIKDLANVYDLQTLAQHEGADGRKKHGESSVLDNIQLLKQAIESKRMIKFQKIEYVAEHTTHTRVDPQIILASPFDLKWEDGEYVLSYAVDFDPIEYDDIDPDDEPCEEEEEMCEELPDDDDDQVDYTRKVSLMSNIQITGLPSTYRDKGNSKIYGDDTKLVTIRFRNDVLERVQAEVGKDAVLIPLDDHHFTINIRRTIDRSFVHWIDSFRCCAKIVSPPWVVEFFFDLLEGELGDQKRMYQHDLEPLHLLSIDEYWALTPEQERLIRPDLNYGCP